MLRPNPAIAGSLTGLVSMRPDVARLTCEFLNPRLDAFLSARGAAGASEIPPETAFHELDFKSRSQHRVDFFYNTVFRDYVQVHDNRLRHAVRYQWTLDGSQCPLLCDVTQLQYALLTVGGAPAAYTMLLPLQELLDYARGCLQEIETENSRPASAPVGSGISKQ